MSQMTKLAIAMLALAAACQAQAQSKGPAAQYWIDLSTTSMSIPGMPEEGSMGGMLGGMLAKGAMGGMGGNSGKTLQAELYVRANPNGVEGTHAIPAGMNMGPSLTLLPIRPRTASSSGPASNTNEPMEKPKGRILIYWGCGDTVRAGQPRILDFSKPDYKEFAQAFASHSSASRGVQGLPGHSIWPNERDSKRVPDNASLQGDQALSGDGVPASFSFNVGTAYDFLPRVQLSTKGMPKDGVQTEWKAMDNAKAYFLVAQGSAAGSDGGRDMIFWTSSEKPDNGWSLMNYQAPAQIAKLLQQKIVLPPTTTTCTVPKGIFDKAEGSMLNMIAYGPELNVSHPARPPKAPADWQPEWTARVRIKSTGMTMLGMEDDGGRRGGRGSSFGGDGGGDAGNGNANADGGAKSQTPELPNPVNILKGLFSR